MKRSVVALWCLAIGLAAASVRAQSFGEELAVTAVEIPVHVLRDGEPVDGLAAADFEVLVDGRPVGIEAFEVLRRTSDPVAPETGGAPATAPAATSRPRHLLVFLDLIFTGPAYRQRALDGVRALVAGQLAPGDRVALAVLSNGGGRVLVPFTSDREELALGLEVMEDLVNARGRKVEQGMARLGSYLESRGRDASLHELTERFGSTAALAIGPGADSLGRSLSLVEELRAEADPPDPMATADPVKGALIRSSPESIGAEMETGGVLTSIAVLSDELARLATLFQGVPAPKEVLYLSQGFPSYLLEDVREGMRGPALRYLRTMHASLVRHGWTLHGFDVEGIPAPKVEASVERASTTRNDVRQGFDAHALFVIANETGGEVLENFNRIGEATARLLSQTRVTYLLTILADGIARDGGRHEIAVRLRRDLPGARIQHRPAFYAAEAADQMDPLERELELMQRLLRGEEENGLGATARAGFVPGQGGGTAVRFLLTTPATAFQGIGKTRQDPTRQDRVAIQVVALDASGGALTVWSRNLPVDSPAMGSRLAREGLQVGGTLITPPGVESLRLLVRVPGAEPALVHLPVTAVWDGPAAPPPRPRDGR